MADYWQRGRPRSWDLEGFPDAGMPPAQHPRLDPVLTSTAAGSNMAAYAAGQYLAPPPPPAAEAFPNHSSYQQPYARSLQGDVVYFPPAPPAAGTGLAFAATGQYVNPAATAAGQAGGGTGYVSYSDFEPPCSQSSLHNPAAQTSADASLVYATAGQYQAPQAAAAAAAAGAGGGGGNGAYSSYSNAQLPSSQYRMQNPQAPAQTAARSSLGFTTAGQYQASGAAAAAATAGGGGRGAAYPSYSNAQLLSSQYRMQEPPAPAAAGSSLGFATAGHYQASGAAAAAGGGGGGCGAAYSSYSSTQQLPSSQYCMNNPPAQAAAGSSLGFASTGQYAAAGAAAAAEGAGRGSSVAAYPNDYEPPQSQVPARTPPAPTAALQLSSGTSLAVAADGQYQYVAARGATAAAVAGGGAAAAAATEAAAGQGGAGNRSYPGYSNVQLPRSQIPQQNRPAAAAAASTAAPQAGSTPAAAQAAATAEEEAADEALFNLPPLNLPAAELAGAALGTLNIVTEFSEGRVLHCRLCRAHDCDCTCPTRNKVLQQQALYEYIVLHEPLTLQQELGSDLSLEDIRQQTEAARALAVSSRTPQQKARDLEECRQLFGLAEADLSDDLISHLTDTRVTSLLQAAANRMQQELLPAQQQQQQQRLLAHQRGSRSNGAHQALLLRCAYRRLMQLEVLEMTHMDLLGALVLLKHAINTVSTTARPQITRSGPQPTQTKPYSGYVSRPAAVQAAQHGSSQLPDEDAAAVQEMLRGIHAQLGALAAAFDAEPLRVRQLARYHRARREAWERQQMDVFVLDWGCAEGGTTNPVPAEGVATLFARCLPGRRLTRLVGTDSVADLAEALCRCWSQPRQRNRAGLAPEIVRGYDGEYFGGQEEEHEGFDISEDLDDDGFGDRCRLRDAAGRVAAVLVSTDMEEHGLRGDFTVITIQHGYSLAAATDVLDSMGWSYYLLQHGTALQPLPQLLPTSAAAWAAATTDIVAAGEEGDVGGWTSVGCFIRAVGAHGRAPSMSVKSLLRSVVENRAPREEVFRKRRHQQQQQQQASSAAATAAAAAADAGTDFTLQVTTGGSGPHHLHVSTLFVFREAGGQCREVGRALVTYRNQYVRDMGPTLELIEVKGRWRRMGVASRLMQAIEQHVLSVWPSLCKDMGGPFMVSHVVGPRAFFEHHGIRWTDGSARSEGFKELFAPAGPCSCGQCTEGVLSGKMRRRLRDTADELANNLQRDIDLAEDSGWFGSSGVHMRVPISMRRLYNSQGAIAVLPAETRQHKLLKTFLNGYRECFDAIATALSTQPHQLPTPLQVLSEWQRTARGLTAQQYFLERGGSVELALALVIDSCCHDEQEWDLSSINRSDAEADDEEDWQGPGPGPSFVGSQPARGVTAGYYPAAAASSQGPSFVGSQPGGRTAGYAASSGVAGGGGFNLRAGAAGSDVLLGGWSSGGGADAAMGGLPASGGPGAPLAFLAQLSGLVRPAVSLPRCVNDCNYSGVFEALLGTKTPRRLPGCHACGLPEDDEVQSDGFDD